jgi:hypothetical protein
MLHFPLDNLDVMYIGVCNWGEVRHLQEVTPFLYHFAQYYDAINVRKTH